MGRAGFGAALVLLAGCASNPPKPGEKVVHKIAIEGNHALSSHEIKAKILTSEESWIPWEAKPYFDPNTWDADLRRIERLYQAQGYYQAEVVRDDVRPHGKEEVNLQVVVSEGKPTRITAIAITGVDDLPPELKGRVLDDLPLKVGQPITEAAWTQTKVKVKASLRELGYAEAQVVGDVFVETTNQTARIVLHAAHSLRYRFGQLNVVTGRRQDVSRARILEQARAAVVPGQWFSESALAEAQARLFAMGVFGAVKVFPDNPDPATQTIPIVVDVREAPFRSLRTGPGLGFDPVRQEARGQVEYIDRNFLGGLRRLTLRGVLGYAFLPGLTDLLSGTAGYNTIQQGPIFELTSEFEQPHFLQRDVKLETSLEGTRGLEQAYQYLSGRASVGLAWKPHPFFTLFGAYNFEADRLRGLTTVTGQGAPTLALGCPRNPCNLFLSYLEQTAEWDRRNDRYEPMHGYYLSLSLQEGGGPLGGDFRYIRVLPDARYYFSPSPRLTFAVHLRAGSLLTPPGEPSPIITRFYSGGNSMRGFSTRRLSPMLASPNLQSIAGQAAYVPADPLLFPGDPHVAGQTVAIGGNGLFEGSFETRYTVFGPIAVAVFLDTGLVSECRFGADPVIRKGVESYRVSAATQCVNDAAYFQKNLQYAVGIGLRYRTVVPIRVDVAYRLNLGPLLPVSQPDNTTVVYPQEGSCFGIGNKGQTIAGSPEGPCTFHLSIGEAF